MTMFGVRFSVTYSDVDYIALVEKDLFDYEKKYGYENVNHKQIRINDTRLLYRVQHLAKYFPCGSVTPSEVLTFFGYDSEVKDKKVIDEESVMKSLHVLFPDRKVYGLTRIRKLYDAVVDLSAQYDMTIEKYLENKGFTMRVNKAAYRLSKAKQDNDDELFEKICEMRKKYISSSVILSDQSSTQSDVSEEIERIGDRVLNNIKISQKHQM